MNLVDIKKANGKKLTTGDYSIKVRRRDRLFVPLNKIYYTILKLIFRGTENLSPCPFPVSFIFLIFDMMNMLKNNISEILIESTSGIIPEVLFDDRTSFKGHNLIRKCNLAALITQMRQSI